jgi:hypothetical protein
MEETTGWDCKERTPAGLCKSSRAVVSVKNLIADSRFPELVRSRRPACCSWSVLVARLPGRF